MFFPVARPAERNKVAVRLLPQSAVAQVVERNGACRSALCAYLFVCFPITISSLNPRRRMIVPLRLTDGESFFFVNVELPFCPGQWAFVFAVRGERGIPKACAAHPLFLHVMYLATLTRSPMSTRFNRASRRTVKTLTPHAADTERTVYFHTLDATFCLFMRPQ